jgi:hypothetical protein
MGGELLDDAQVERLCSVGESGELKVLVHALAKQGAHERSFPNGGLNNRLESTLSPRRTAVSRAARSACDGETTDGGPANPGHESSCRAAAYLNPKPGLPPQPPRFIIKVFVEGRYRAACCSFLSCRRSAGS